MGIGSGKEGKVIEIDGLKEDLKQVDSLIQKALFSSGTRTGIRNNTTSKSLSALSLKIRGA